MSFRNVLSLQRGMDVLLENKMWQIWWTTPPSQEEWLRLVTILTSPMGASCCECEAPGEAPVRQRVLAANGGGNPGPVASYTRELREMTTTPVNAWLPPEREGHEQSPVETGASVKLW